MPDADRINIADLPTLDRDRFLVAAHRRGNAARRSRCARMSRCRRSRAPTAARWPRSTPTAATATRRRATRRRRASLQRSRARRRGRARRHARAVRFAHAAAAGGARRIRVSVARRADAFAPRVVRAPDAANRRQAGIDPRIVDWETYVEVRTATHRLITSAGGDIIQRYRFLFPGMSVTAHADGDTQTRTLNGYRGICQQGGDEILARFGFDGAGAPASPTKRSSSSRRRTARAGRWTCC